MKMAALEAALEKTINELSQDGRILENDSRADESADASANDINAQIDRWLYLHENDTQLQLIDDSLSESDSGTAHFDSLTIRPICSRLTEFMSQEPGQALPQALSQGCRVALRTSPIRPLRIRPNMTSKRKRA